MKNKGFTLIEVLLVVAIMLTMGTLATSFYGGFVSKQSSIDAQNKVYAIVRQAQAYTMNGRRGTQWGVHAQGNSIVLFSGSSWAARTAALDQVIELPGNSTVNAFADIIFSRGSGIPSAATTITITATADSKQVTVTTEGAINAL